MMKNEDDDDDGDIDGKEEEEQYCTKIRKTALSRFLPDLSY